MKVIFSYILLAIGTQLPLDTDSILLQAKKLQEDANFEEALVVLREYLLNNELDLEDKGKIHLRLGYILGNLHKTEQSVLHYKTAVDLGQKDQIDFLIAQGYLGIGGIYQITEKTDSALKYYQKSLPLLKSLQDSLNIEGMYANIALIVSKNNHIDSAVRTFEQSIKNRFEIDDLKGVVGSMYNLGNLYYRTNNINKAKEYFQRSLQIAKSIGSQYNVSKAYRGLANVSFLKQDYQEASLLFLKYDSLATQFLHEDYSDKILDLETKYRTAEIERDNAIKQVQIEVQDQRMIYLYVIAGLLSLGILGIYLYNEQRKKVIRALALQKDQENEKRINDLLNDQELKSAYAMLAGQEKAHKRIAEELHDNLGSILVTLNMFADSLQNKKDPQAQKELAGRISEIAHQANETTRQISHSLHSGVLKHFGLEIAIKELIEALNESDSVAVESHVQITAKLDSDLSMNIYRIVQELVNNTLKHSKATKITLDLNQIKDHLSLIYSDNGVGLNQEQIVNGLGLKNLESRVDRLDGTITTESKPGQGTTTIIEVPVS